MQTKTEAAVPAEPMMFLSTMKSDRPLAFTIDESLSDAEYFEMLSNAKTPVMVVFAKQGRPYQA